LRRARYVDVIRRLGPLPDPVLVRKRRAVTWATPSVDVVGVIDEDQNEVVGVVVFIDQRL
jgi:hypothetical protein